MFRPTDRFPPKGDKTGANVLRTRTDREVERLSKGICELTYGGADLYQKKTAARGSLFSAKVGKAVSNRCAVMYLAHHWSGHLEVRRHLPRRSVHRGIEHKG